MSLLEKDFEIILKKVFLIESINLEIRNLIFVEELENNYFLIFYDGIEIGKAKHILHNGLKFTQTYKMPYFKTISYLQTKIKTLVNERQRIENLKKNNPDFNNMHEIEEIKNDITETENVIFLLRNL